MPELLQTDEWGFPDGVLFWPRPAHAGDALTAQGVLNRCPECQSPDTEQVWGRQRRCRECGRVWSRKG